MAYENAGFTQEEVDRYKNINDRGVGTPVPSVATPSASTQDYVSGPAGLKLQKSLIPPELQGIIDKVTNASSSISPRQRSDIAHLAGTVGGLQQQRMTEQGQMARLGITGAAEMAKTNLTEAGATERTKTATKPGLMREERAGTPIPGSASLVKGMGIGETKDVLDDWDSFRKKYFQ